MVSAPVTSHTNSSQPGAPTCRVISAETMKMPEPIIDPATIMVESSRPRPWTNFGSAGAAIISVPGMLGAVYFQGYVPQLNIRGLEGQSQNTRNQPPENPAYYGVAA